MKNVSTHQEGKKLKRTNKNELQILALELRALLTCTKPKVILQRFATRSWPMISRIKNLKRFFDLAQEYEQSRIKEKKRIIRNLDELYIRLNLSEISEINKKKPHRVLEIFQAEPNWWLEPTWIWIQSLKNPLNEDQLDFVSNYILWHQYVETRYPIGQHPAISLALLKSIFEFYKTLSENSGNDFEEQCVEEQLQYIDEERKTCLSNSLQEVVNSLREATLNLKEELPLLKTWPNHLYEVFDLQNFIEKLFDIMVRGLPNYNLSEIARYISQNIPTEYRIGPRAVRERLRDLDRIRRSEEDRKKIRGRRRKN